MLDLVRLANGTEVTWDEFSKWTSHKQILSLNPPNKNRKWDESFGRKISESKRIAKENGVIYKLSKGEDHVFSRRVKTPKGECVSIKEAASLYGVRGDTLRNWIKSGKDGFEFITPPSIRKEPHKKGGRSGGENGSARSVITPQGKFESLKAASLHFCVSTGVMSNWIKNVKSKEFFYEKEIVIRKAFKNLNKRTIKTPDGIFNGLKEAGDYYGVCGESIRQRITIMKWDGWEYIS